MPQVYRASHKHGIELLSSAKSLNCNKYFFTQRYCVSDQIEYITKPLNIFILEHYSQDWSKKPVT